MMNKILSLALCGLMAVPAFAQQTKILTAEKHNEYGLVYSLPTTALQIKVTARRETRKAGPYSQYAKHYLGTSDVILQDAVNWTVTEISVTPVGVKDDDTKYLMQLKPGALTYIGVAADGMLLSINTEPDEPDTSAGQGSVDVAGIVLQEGGNVEDYLKYVDMDFVSAQNSMRQAELVANSLMDVRDAYLSLTRGTADNTPTDGQQLQLMLNSLKNQEDAFTRAFKGSVTIEEFSREFTYIPEQDGEDVLFRLSNYAGIVDPDDLSGSPVFIKTEVLLEGELPTDVNGEPKKFPKDGIVYALPGTAKISVYTDRMGFYSKEFEFSQFGTTFALAPTLFTDKKAPSYAKFSPVTGALIEIGKAASE